MSDKKQNTSKLLNFITDKFQNDELDNDSLVQIIEHCGAFLNLMTISDYARSNNISYNGTKKFRNVVKIFKTKYVIDNE